MLDNKSILIVEDEQAIADGIAYALRTDGLVPRHVILGTLALHEARSDPPALIILDIGLPDLNGFEVCRQLRQFCQAPIIFLTARSDEIDRIVGLELGADDYMTKPFSPRELVARVRANLRRVEQLAPPSLAVSRLELREAEARILFHGHPLDLTRYEYLLLKTLLHHPGHLLSRAQLMEQVWTDALDTLGRTVDSHIKSVRAKLRAIDAEDSSIETCRGLGYRFNPQ